MIWEALCWHRERLSTAVLTHLVLVPRVRLTHVQRIPILELFGLVLFDGGMERCRRGVCRGGHGWVVRVPSRVCCQAGVCWAASTGLSVLAIGTAVDKPSGDCAFISLVLVSDADSLRWLDSSANLELTSRPCTWTSRPGRVSRDMGVHLLAAMQLSARCRPGLGLDKRSDTDRGIRDIFLPVSRRCCFHCLPIVGCVTLQGHKALVKTANRSGCVPANTACPCLATCAATQLVCL